MNVGFAGLGTMGLPMATRLLAAGTALTVWNRTPARAASLLDRGARRADTVDALFADCEAVLLMLLDQEAVDAVLGRGTGAFAPRVRGRLVVMLGTVAPAYSQALDAAIRRCGGRYVEAPVSGSRGPAEAGSLVGMLAGDAADVARVDALLRPLCRERVACGAVPAALRTKLAVNHFLIALVSALAETVQAAAACGVDLALLQQVLDAGPMASAVSRGKLAKLLTRDFSAQAAIGDVAQIARLVRAEVRAAGVPAPHIEAAASLFGAAQQRGLAALDMAAVLQPTPTTPGSAAP